MTLTERATSIFQKSIIVMQFNNIETSSFPLMALFQQLYYLLGAEMTCAKRLCCQQ